MRKRSPKSSVYYITKCGRTARLPRGCLLVIDQSGAVQLKVSGAPVTFNFMDLDGFEQELFKSRVYGLCVLLPQ